MQWNWETLLPALIGFVGVLVGGIVTMLGQFLLARRATTTQNLEASQHAAIAAGEYVRALSRNIRENWLSDDDLKAVGERIHLQEEARSHALRVRDEAVREHLLWAEEALRRAPVIHGETRKSEAAVSYDVVLWAEEVVGAYIRGDEPPSRTPNLEVYAAALVAVDKALDDGFEREDRETAEAIERAARDKT